MAFNLKNYIRITNWFSLKNFIHSLTSYKFLNNKSSLTVTIGISSFFCAPKQNILLCMFFDIFFWIQFLLRLDLWLFNLKESGKCNKTEMNKKLFIYFFTSSNERISCWGTIKSVQNRHYLLDKKITWNVAEIRCFKNKSLYVLADDNK